MISASWVTNRVRHRDPGWPLGGKPRVDGEQALQAQQESSAAGHECHRKRHLHDHHRTEQPAGHSSLETASAALAHDVREVDARHGHGRSNPDQRPGDKHQ
jgi:hypothetical protein